MLAYAILVTFLFGMLMGACVTVIAALRMEACDKCQKPAVAVRKEGPRVGPNPFMPDILEYEKQ